MKKLRYLAIGLIAVFAIIACNNDDNTEDPVPHTSETELQ